MANSVLLSDLEQIHATIGARRARFDGSVILVTGCAGFLGMYFMNYLVRYAWSLGVRKVIGLDTFLLSKPRWLEDLVRDYPDIVDLTSFDISTDSLENIPQAKHARFVLHMASIASPTFYRRYPLETIDGNIWGLRRLLNFYDGSKELEGFLFFSSSEIYGDPDPANIPTPEDYRGNVACTGPRACYDESKRFGETLCYVYAATRGLPITVVRPFNNYGPGMRIDDRRLPADLAHCVLEEKDIVLYSSGSPTRTFCYISDAITGYLLCLLYGKFDAFNIGIEKPEISVRDLAEIYRKAAAEIVGYKGEVRFEVSDDKEYLSHNPQRRCPVITKARTVLGYAPEVLVEDGVGRYLRHLLEARG